MSGIAKVLLELGYQVSGSDLQSSETTRRLEKMGGTIFLGHHENNLGPDVETVVVSSAIPANNDEVVKAQNLGIPIIQRAEMLGRLMKNQKGIAIAGAHGKTTTTSLISLMFEKNNYDPTVVVGGELNDIGGNAKLGRGEYLVAEADESDGSFLKLHPYITVITNIEDDHLDYYHTRENIRKAFEQFIALTNPQGFSVLCLDDPILSDVIRQGRIKNRIVTYGFSPDAEFSAVDIKLQGLYTKAVIRHQGKELGFLSLSVPGKHNVLNAMAAIAVGINCGLEFQDIADALHPFTGVQRRFQKIGEAKGALIYDDYAHHPTELKATLNAARTLKPQRIVAVFQPHRYSRTHLLAGEFGLAFVEADLLILNEVYPAGEKPIPGVSAQLIADEVRTRSGQDMEYIASREEIVDRLEEIIRPGDLVITMGAGNIYTVGQDLCHRLAPEK